jgi:PAS domain S-box-containing protein
MRAWRDESHDMPNSAGSARTLDAWGLPLTAASPEAATAYNTTIAAYLCFSRDTGLQLKALFAADPHMPMAQVLRGSFLNLMGQAALQPKAREAAAAAQEQSERCTPRERLHIEALCAWCAGEMEQAAERWEAILLDHPHDVLALKLASFTYFYLGDCASVRDNAARVLPAWDPALPGYSYLLGMHAFGLEECGDYEAAERRGREALAMERNDPWAVHAVAHVMEMQDRCEQGIAWISEYEPEWDRCNNFRFHLWWHRALMHLGLDQYDEVLALYDQAVFDPQSEDYLDLCNDIALLVRLEMAGIDVGDRWQQLAVKVASQRSGRVLAFIDAHYLIATAAAEGIPAARSMATDLHRFAAAGRGTTARVTAELGLPLAEAMIAYRAGDYPRCVAKLAPVRRALPRLGGSHAQRDLFVQLLIDAAMRSGALDLARALVAERLALRPGNGWGRQRHARIAAELGIERGASRRNAPIPGTDPHRPDLTQASAPLAAASAASPRAEDRLRQIMDGLHIGIAVTTPDGIVLEINRAALEPAQLTIDQVRGRKLEEMPLGGGDPEVGRALADAVRRAAAGERVRGDIVVKLGSRLLPLELTAAPVRDVHGRIVNVILSAVDIEERQRADARLRASEERYRHLFEGLAVPAYMYDLDSLQFVAVNDAASAHYGYSREEFLALDLAAIRPPEDIPLLHERVAEVARTPAGTLLQMRLRHRKKNGEIMHAELHIHRVDLEGRRAAIVSVLDVSERLRAEQEAAARERRLRAQNIGMAALSRSDKLERKGLDEALNEIVQATAAALDVARVGIWLFDPARTQLLCQVTYEDRSGFRVDEAITAADHRAYFRAVDSDRILAIDDARASALTASMAAYLAAHEIGAMLDAPIVKLGRRVGVLCIEHEGGPRNWHPDEETFAMLAADFVGIVLEADGRLQAQRALQEYSDRLAALSRRLLVAQEAERRAVARELHDEIGQALTAVKLHLNVAARAPEREATAAALVQASEVVNGAIAQVRDKALDLRPSMLDDSGLVPALRWYLERFEQRSGMEVRLTAAICDRLPTSEQETVCFRLVQEALTNAVRHAQARRVRVSLARVSDGVEISVRDDGKGFDVQAALDRARRGEALGLAGMQERVSLIGGEIEIQSGPGEGCEIRVRVPFAPQRS